MAKTKKPKTQKAKTKKPQKPTRLPGDLTEKQMIDRIIRVDHAGEYGAKRIYQGQLAVLGKTADGPLLQEMLDHELEHLQYFETKIPERGVRPTALLPLWHIGGFAMGAVTALIGREAAMACTVAVEEAIEQHYQKQIEELAGNEGEKDLRKAIEKFCADEVHHRDIGLEQGAERAPAYQLLYKVVSGITKRAIWLSERV